VLFRSIDVTDGNALGFNSGALAVQEGNISLSNLSGYPIEIGRASCRERVYSGV
jgi:hypothetical protein